MKEKSISPVIKAFLAWISISAIILLFIKDNFVSFKNLALIILVFVICFIKRNYIAKNFFVIDTYTYISVLMLIGVSIEFYYSWEPYDTINKIADMIGINGIHEILGVTIFRTLLAILGLALINRCIFKSILNIDRDNIRNYKFIIKPICIFSAIYLVANISIIRANYNYIDDMGRVVTGYKKWDIMSRFISNYLSNYIHGNSYLTDVSPLTQIIASLILAVASAVVLYAVTNRSEYKIYEYCAIIPLGLSPYFMECISYKYDAPYMALSILAAVIPLLFINSENKCKKLALMSFIGTLAVCMTYQAASGIFPFAIIFICAIRWIKAEWSFKNIRNVLLSSIVGFASGIVLFRIFIMIPVETYVSNTIPGLKEFISNVIKNYRTYYRLILQDFTTVWLSIIVLLLISFVISALLTTKRNKIITLIVSLATELITLLLAFGLYPALTVPQTATRAMYGFGVWIALLGISATTLAYKKKELFVSKLCVIIISCLFFAFSFTYGNALYIQKEYTNYRINEIANDINTIVDSGEKRDFQIKGNIGYAPAVRNEIANYPILHRLVPVTCREKWYWGAYEICSNYDLPIRNYNTADDLSVLELPMLKKTNHYTIFGDDKYILVDFNVKK